MILVYSVNDYVDVEQHQATEKRGQYTDPKRHAVQDALGIIPMAVVCFFDKHGSIHLVG
jgi:hypothetical protein